MLLRFGFIAYAARTAVCLPLALLFVGLVLESHRQIRRGGKGAYKGKSFVLSQLQVIFALALLHEQGSVQAEPADEKVQARGHDERVQNHLHSFKSWRRWMKSRPRLREPTAQSCR